MGLGIQFSYWNTVCKGPQAQPFGRGNFDVHRCGSTARDWTKWNKLRSAIWIHSPFGSTNLILPKFLELTIYGLPTQISNSHQAFTQHAMKINCERCSDLTWSGTNHWFEHKVWQPTVPHCFGGFASLSLEMIETTLNVLARMAFNCQKYLHGSAFLSAWRGYLPMGIQFPRTVLIRSIQNCEAVTTEAKKSIGSTPHLSPVTKCRWTIQ